MAKPGPYSASLRTNPRQSHRAGWHDKGLKIRLKAAPVEGEANTQLIKFLAKQFKVTLADITLLKGETHRQKTLRIDQPGLLPDLLSGIES